MLHQLISLMLPIAPFTLRLTRLAESVTTELLDEGSTLIVVGASAHGPVRIRRGVCQGDPLAFSFAFDPVIRALFALKGVTVLSSLTTS